MDNENNNSMEINSELARTYMRRRRIIWGCAFAVLALMGAYMIWSVVNKTGMGTTYAVLLCAALAVFWLLTDVISPIAVHAFDGRSPKQKSAYMKYAGLELIGYAGLAYFGITAMSNRSSIYGAVAFLIATLNKRRFLDAYVSDQEEEPEEAEESEIESGMTQEPKSGAAKVSQLSAADRLARLQASIADDNEDAEEAMPDEPAQDTENTEEEEQ